MFRDNKTLNLLVNISLVLIIIFLFTKISFILSPIIEIGKTLVVPIIISIFLYYTIRPLLNLFKRSKLNKSIQIILVLVGLTFIFLIIMYYGGAVIKEQFSSFLKANTNTISSPKNFIGEKLGQFLPNIEISQNIISSANSILKKLGDNIGSVFSQLGSLGTQIALVPFILFYFLKDDEGFTNSFLSVIPSRYKKVVKDMLKQINAALSIYISGQLLVALVIGILMYIGYLIIGMPNAILMGFFSMITSIIPFIGPFLGIIPAVLTALTIDVSLIFKIALIAVVVQQIEGNLITPNIVGNKLNIHPLAVIFIIIISVSLFGFMGAFIGIPLYISTKIIISTLNKIYSMNKFQVK